MEFEKHSLERYAYLRYETSPKLIQGTFAQTDVANEVSTPKVVSRLTASYSMLTITLYSSECYVLSGLDFEAAGDSVVHYFVSNYLL